MKIGLSTSVIQRGRTGIAEYVFSLVREFEAHTGTRRFVLFVLEEDLPLFEFAKHFVRLVAVSEAFRPPLKDIFWHQTILPRLARRLGLDVLHVPSYRRLPWRKPCALTATVHDLAAFHVAKKYDWKRMFYGRGVARRLAERQDEIITVSQNTARDIGTFWKLPREKITVIHHGVDHGRFFPVLHEIARSTGLKHFGLDRPFFLYVARLEHPAKNHLRLVAAFEQFKSETGSPWQLVLAGGDWHGAETIHAAISRSRFAGDIRCLGFVPEAELPLLYRSADVFVYPSLYEGFGFPPLEAMACGCPVLCSARGALGEIVGNAAVIVDPEDVPALKSQLARLAADAGWRERLRAAGLEHARQFDWQRAAARTLEVYARAAARRKIQLRRAGVESVISVPHISREARESSGGK
ncbi:MAG TPA: glycosyltransferase family 1 protein [Verrucomicrobiae bacterium]|nr:glycosyltransferase family 1 protein [Verrucomicrobiae bacterium]